MLAAALEKVRATDFGGPDRWELTDWLWKCQNMARREARMRIINDLPERIRTSRIRDDQNDRFDIRGIVDACLNYSGDLKELMSILRTAENNSEQLQDVENYLENFLQQKHIVAPDPEAEKQIEQLTVLLVGMQSFIHTVDLEQVYHASAPQLDFSDTTWRYPKDLKLARVIDRVLHHLNVAPASKPGVPPILIFVERLACYTHDAKEQQKLWTWVDNEAVPTWQVKAEAMRALRQQLTEEAQQDEETTEVQSIPSEFLEEAHSFIAKAKQYVLEATAPFNGKGYIPPRKFRTASKLLNTANEYLQNLCIFLDKTIPLLTVTIPNHQDLINTIHTIAAQTINLSSYIGDHQPIRQNIRESALKLVQDLNELDMCIQGKGM